MKTHIHFLSAVFTLGMAVSLGGALSAWAQTPAPPTPGAAPRAAPPAADPGKPVPAAAAPSAPAETADSLLLRVDKQGTSFKDALFRFKMRIKEPDGSAREIEFSTTQKGVKRLVRFLAPGDVKGLGILVESPEVTYAMLPAFGNRVRRLGTHQLNQSFMGSDVSNDDMATVEFASSYSPKLSGGEGGDSILDMQLKPGKRSECARLKMWVNILNATLSKIECYEAAGKKIRSSVRSDYKKDGVQHWSPSKIVFIDHRKNNHETELLLLESKLDNNFSDEEFTQRALQRN